MAMDIVTEMISEAEPVWKNLKIFDDALHWKYAAPYMPSTNKGALAAEYNTLIERAELPVLNMIVDALVDRLSVVGVRTDPGSPLDQRVWQWWQASSMDQSQVKVYRDAVGMADGYVSVTPGGDMPIFRPESPQALAVRTDPADPTIVVTAVKVVDKTAWLYTADSITRYEQTKNSSRWVPAGESVSHAAGVCPIVRFPNQVDTLGRSFSEIEPILPIQARINQTVMDRLLLQRSQAWRQRWVAGIEVDKAEDGTPVPPFKTGSDTLLVAPSPETKFGEFQQADLTGLLRAVEADISAAAMASRTPPHYLPQASISNVSEAALVALEAAFASKVSERQTLWGEAWEYAMWIGGRMVGVDVPVESEVVWADLELRSEAQKVDAAQKLRTMGVPLSIVLERLGYSDALIERVEAAAKEESMTAASAQAKAFGVDGADGDITG